MSQNYNEIMFLKIKELNNPLLNDEVKEYLKKAKVLYFDSKLDNNIKYNLDLVCKEKNIRWRTGRPSKLNQKRKNQTIRLSEKEKDILKKEHKKQLEELVINEKIYPFTQFLRDKLLKKVTIKQSFEVSKLVFEVNKIGNNINQIAKKINSYNDNYTAQLSYKIDKDYKELRLNMFDLLKKIENNDS